MFGMVAMLVAHLEGVDLNLLSPLAALLEERQVTRAAERSGLSQPAMSRALARLRRLLDDQLLVRDGSGYVLTPRAERIQGQLAGLMPQLETLFAAEVFDRRLRRSTTASRRPITRSFCSSIRSLAR